MRLPDFLAMAFAVMLLSCGLTQAATTSSDEETLPVYWAHDFSDSVGVNTHLLHADSFYGAQFELMKKRLLSARIKHIRDGAMDQRGGFFRGDQAERFRELGDAGIRVTFIFRVSASREFVQGFPSRVAPAFEAYELPNELNIQNAVPWIETLRSLMPTFKEQVKSNPATATYPIVGPSFADMGNDPYGKIGDEEENLDYGNLHKYYRNHHPGTIGYGSLGRPPCDAYRYGSLDYAMCHVAKISGRKPVMSTEAGYGSNPEIKRQVPPETQAKYIARMLMLHLKAGIHRTFIYALADYGQDEWTGYGLLTANGEEKPAYRELSSLMYELEDKPRTGTPDRLPLSIDGDLTSMERMLFQKSDGSFRLVMWLEKPGFDPKSEKPIEVPAQKVVVTLPPPYRVRGQLTFTPSGTAIVEQPSPSPARIELAIQDNLKIIDIARWPFTIPRPPTIHPLQ